MGSHASRARGLVLGLIRALIPYASIDLKKKKKKLSEQPSPRSSSQLLIKTLRALPVDELSLQFVLLEGVAVAVYEVLEFFFFPPL